MKNERNGGQGQGKPRHQELMDLKSNKSKVPAIIGQRLTNLFKKKPTSGQTAIGCHYSDDEAPR